VCRGVARLQNFGVVSGGGGGGGAQRGAWSTNVSNVRRLAFVAFVAWQDAAGAVYAARRAAQLSRALTERAVVRHARGVAARHLRRTLLAWYGWSGADIHAAWRQSRAAALVATVSAHRAHLAMRHAFAALTALGRRRAARLAREALLMKVVAASRIMYGLRVKRWVMTALYAAVELSRAWRLTLADVGADARYFCKVKYLRAWRRNARATADTAAAREHREEAVFTLTTRNALRLRVTAVRRVFQVWRGALRAAVRAHRMELRATRHKAYVGRRAAVACWRAWCREAGEERKRRVEEGRRFQLVRGRTRARGVRRSLQRWRLHASSGKRQRRIIAVGLRLRGMLERKAAAASLGAWRALARRRAIIAQLCARVAVRKAGVVRRRLFLRWVAFAAASREVETTVGLCTS
jgi:hypothetical protein